MKLKYKFMIQKVGDHYMAVDTTGQDSDFKGIVKLNETGKFIFEVLKEDTKFNDLVDKVAKEFDGSREEIENSCIDFCTALQLKGIITED